MRVPSFSFFILPILESLSKRFVYRDKTFVYVANLREIFDLEIRAIGRVARIVGGLITWVEALRLRVLVRIVVFR